VFLVYGLLTLAGVLSLFPLYWLFVTSLSPQQFIIKVPPDLIPTDITLQNYQRLFSTTPVVRWLLNTVIIAGVITLFHLMFDSTWPATRLPNASFRAKTCCSGWCSARSPCRCR
jgi:multiple sugar transport system permease protein